MSGYEHLTRLQIPVYQKGTAVAWAFVEGRDYAKVAEYKWYLHKTGYVARRETRKDRPKGRLGIIYLHRFVMDATRKEKRVVDHINKNPLDCRRANLRLLSRGSNGWGNRQKTQVTYSPNDYMDLPEMGR